MLHLPLGLIKVWTEPGKTGFKSPRSHEMHGGSLGRSTPFQANLQDGNGINEVRPCLQPPGGRTVQKPEATEAVEENRKYCLKAVRRPQARRCSQDRL